jgi:Sperm-tail PG-rich repeat
VPGPGNYNPRKRPTSAAPAYGFGSSTRGQLTREATPGPGTYKVPSRIQDVPHYLLPNRDAEFKYV